jgi:PAS domain S-box-containing protein
MPPKQKQPYQYVLATNWKLAGIAALFLLTIAGVVLQTISTINGRHTDGVIIDVAGRQRMLIERHLKEVFLASEGRRMDYSSTRKMLTDTLKALMRGGPAFLGLTESESVQLPPAPTRAIEVKLAEQERLLHTVFMKADTFLQVPGGTRDHDVARENLLQSNAHLLTVTNDGVALLTRYAEGKAASTVRWEIAVALATGLFGGFLTWQVARTNTKVAREIVERQRAEEEFRGSQTITLEALRASEERYRVLYEDNPSMYFTVAADGTVLSVNRFGTEQLGYQADELVGHSVLTVFHADDRDKAMECLRTAFRSPAQVHQWELRKVRKDGRVLWVREDVRIIQDIAGNPLALIVCDDITERQRAEERLRKSQTAMLEALRHSDALKSALLSSVSHELRTPLTAIKALVAGLADDSDDATPPGATDLVERINQQIDYLNKVIENLLDMSAIEAGRLVPNRDWHVLEELIEGAIRRIGHPRHTRRIDVKLAEELPAMSVDALQMQRVLVNLLDNAIKYSPSGSPIHLDAERLGEAITVRVSNAGETISPEELERVFDRFHRVRVARTRPIPGSGLGLAICKAIVEAHGGRIWANSSLTETTITFTLPVMPFPTPDAELKPTGRAQRFV